MKGGQFRPQTMPVVGTTPIEIPLHLALPLLHLAGRTICGPHGLQFLQLLGGRFGQMTVAVPIDHEFGEIKNEYTSVHPRMYMTQFMCPEVCIGLPFAEFWVPFDGAETEIKRVALAMADASFDDPNCLKRIEGNGRPYLDEHKDWLSSLIQPVGL